jgi:hypothetical protein
MAHVSVVRRYADLADQKLATTLAVEDSAEKKGLSPFERITCRVHCRWVHECVVSPVHVVAVSGHRWCEDCAVPATVAVDQLLCTVEVRCPRCRCVPACPATEQIVRTCLASLRAARQPITWPVPSTRSA